MNEDAMITNGTSQASVLPRALTDQVEPSERMRLKILKLQQMQTKTKSIKHLTSDVIDINQNIDDMKKRSRFVRDGGTFDGNLAIKRIRRDKLAEASGSGKQRQVAEDPSTSISVIKQVMKLEAVQRIMRRKFEAELNLLSKVELGRTRFCCAKLRTNGYCLETKPTCPHHKRKPIFPTRYIKNQIMYCLRESLIAQGWNFNIGETDAGMVNQVPLYTGVFNSQLDISNTPTLFSKRFFQLFLRNKKPLESPCVSFIPEEVQSRTKLLMDVVYKRYVQILGNLSIGADVEERMYIPCQYSPCACNEMPGKCKQDYRLISMKDAMQKSKIMSVKLRRGRISKIFKQTDAVLYQDEFVFKYPTKALVLNGPIPIHYDWDRNGERILLTPKEAFERHDVIFEIQMFDGSTEIWSAEYAYACLLDLPQNEIQTNLIGVVFGEECNPARVLKGHKAPDGSDRHYYMVYEENNQNVYHLDELEICRRILCTPHVNCACPGHDHIGMLQYVPNANNLRSNAVDFQGLDCLKLVVNRDFPSGVFVDNLYGSNHGVDLEVHLLDLNTRGLYINGRNEMIPAIATLVYADTLKNVNSMDAGLQMVTDLSMLRPRRSMLVFFGGVMKIRIKITLLSSNHVGRKFCICFKIDPRWETYCANINTGLGSWPKVYTNPILVQNTRLEPVIEEAKYLIDYEASNFYFAALIEQLKEVLGQQGETEAEEGPLNKPIPLLSKIELYRTRIKLKSQRRIYSMYNDMDEAENSSAIRHALQEENAGDVILKDKEKEGEASGVVGTMAAGQGHGIGTAQNDNGINEMIEQSDKQNEIGKSDIRPQISKGEKYLQKVVIEPQPMKQPSIKTGVFQDGSMPHEIDSDFEFVDAEDLFDDEENNLVGKHIEIYSQANKGWNTAYVLRYVRGIHHVLLFNGYSEWIDLSKSKFHVRSGLVCKFCGVSFRDIESYKVHVDKECNIRKDGLLKGFEARQNMHGAKEEVQHHRDLVVANYMDQTFLKHTSAAIQRYTNLLAKERSRTSRMVDKYKFWKKKYLALKTKVAEKEVKIDEVQVDEFEHLGSSRVASNNK